MSKKTKNKLPSSNKTKYMYVPIYSEEESVKDEIEFSKSISNGNVTDWDGFQRLMCKDILHNSKILEDEYLGCVKLEDAVMALKHPRHQWRTLLAISDELMRISPHYYRLNNMYSNMALFCWGIDLYDVKENANKKTIKKMYLALASKLESMNLKHEFSKIMKVLPYQDIYCGLLMENNDTCFIQQISYKICKLYEVQDGLYNFAINLSDINPNKLYAYPDYVIKAYDDFINNKVDENNEDIICNWYIPPADKQVCFKLNSQWSYPFPMLISLVKDIIDLDLYKKLKLQSARTDNYKAIMIKVPIDNSTVDKPLLTPKTLGVFAQINRQSMNDDIGIIHTLGSDGEAISFKDSSNSRNNVSDAIDEIYNSSGLSKELFNGSSSGTAVTLSIENDSGFIYGLYRQFERWVNRFIRLRGYNKTLYKYSFYLLDITIFNRKDVINKYKESCTLGVPVIDKYLASLDVSPSKTLGSYVIHNDIFDYQNNFKPLSSTYTSNIESNNGRPTNESQGELLSDSGEQTADSDANIDR